MGKHLWLVLAIFAALTIYAAGRLRGAGDASLVPTVLLTAGSLAMGTLAGKTRLLEDSFNDLTEAITRLRMRGPITGDDLFRTLAEVKRKNK